MLCMHLETLNLLYRLLNNQRIGVQEMMKEDDNTEDGNGGRDEEIALSTSWT